MKDSEKSYFLEMQQSEKKFPSNKDGFQILDLMKYVDLYELEKELPKKNSKELLGFDKTISELFIHYRTTFSQVSKELEKWASHRRLFLKALKSGIEGLVTIKTYSSQAKIAFSTVDVIGSSLSLVLGHFEKNCATTVLYTAAAFGCLSFFTSMFDITKTSWIMERILKELRTDAEYLEKIQDLLQKMYAFDRNVQKLFPYGIDARVVKLIQEPYTARNTNAEDYKNVIKSLSETNEKGHIFLSVLISNTRRNPELLRDKEFMLKAKAFANSSVAEKWWNRMKCHGMLPIMLKSKLFTYLNSFSRLESMPIRTFPMLSSPVWHLNGFPTFGAIFMNSLVVFDSYCDLIQNGKTREVDILEELQHTLEVEYKRIMDVYQKLTPYNDE